MDFSDLLRRRRMVRHYRTDPVESETLQRILQVVRRAPSAGFSQGHRVVVVTDAERRKRIAELCQGWYVANGFEPWLEQAPVHLVLGIREDAYHERYQEADKLEDGAEEIAWPVPFWWFDAGALFMLLQLAAINEGLVAGFHSPEDEDEQAAIGRLVDMPADTATLGLLTIGHPIDDAIVPSAKIAKRRKPLHELVRWQTWAADEG